MNTNFFEKKELSNPLAIPLREKSPFVSSKKKKIILIAGPTAVGKTALSLLIARAIGGEVISADSMQVYRGMDIGTAKVTAAERGNIRHHLIDSRDLDESFNVVDFYNDSRQALREIAARDHVPLVVGGTGFYMHAFIYGPPTGPPAHPELREKLEKEMELQGPLILYERLSLLDPEYAKTITFRDRQKIIRALEIITLTHQKVSFFQRGVEPTEEYDFRCWFIHMPKEILYPRIEERCERMISQGFLEEVVCLEREGLRANLSASQAIGYKQALDFLSTAQTEADWEQFMKAFKQASRRYAKRQFTWFKKEPLFRWLDVSERDLDTAVEIILQDYEMK